MTPTCQSGQTREGKMICKKKSLKTGNGKGRNDANISMKGNGKWRNDTNMPVNERKEKGEVTPNSHGTTEKGKMTPKCCSEKKGKGELMPKCQSG